MKTRRTTRHIAVLVTLGMAAAGCSGPGSRAPVAGPTTTSVSTINTAGSQATGPPATVAAGAVVTGAGAVLIPPIQSASRTYDDKRGCQSLTDDGWSSECEVFSSAAGKAAWLVEYKGTGGLGDEAAAKRALLYRQAASGQWSLSLRASDDDGKSWESVAARTADVAGDGNTKAVYAIVLRTGTSTRAIDVAEPSGVVVLHLQLSGATARLATGGGIEYWTPSAGNKYDHRIIRYQQGAWRAVVAEQVPGEQVPHLVPTSPGRL